MLDLHRLSTLARFPETPLTLDEVRELAALAREAVEELVHLRDADATLEAAGAKALWVLMMRPDIVNYVATTYMRGDQQWEILSQRVGGKTPAQRITELEAEVAELRASIKCRENEDFNNMVERYFCDD